MKKEEHPAPDTIIRDIAIIFAVCIVVYVTTNITPITIDTVFSGAAPVAILSFIIGDIDVRPVQNFFVSLQATLAVLSVLFLIGIFWVGIKIREIHHHEHEKYSPIPIEEAAAKEKSIRWHVILDHVNSQSSAEWKIAILEADNILDEILTDQGYVGDTVAEKLKTMSRTKIASYDDLWQAHIVRNKIAHGGAIDMDLSQKMARDTIAKFENAFKELGYL